MRTCRTVRPLTVVVGLLATYVGQAQVSTLGNNATFGDYVGCDNTSPFPLRIMQNDNHEIELWTDTIQRVELNQTTSYVVNPAQSAKTADGWTLISPDIAQFFTNGAPGPYSLLHLAAADDNAQLGSDREWMDVGITITGNGDHGYLGQKANGLDRTDMIAHWSDNPATFYGPDRYRWIFTSGYNGSNATGAQSDEGLEAMRIFPVSNDECFIGMGDWFAANVADPTITEPEERLDVVDGRVRIRQLPNEAEMDTVEKVVVVNEDGVLGWQWESNINGTGGTSCDWELSTGADKMWTAFEPIGTNGGCPEMDWQVCIGTDAPASAYKVTVVSDREESRRPSGISVSVKGRDDETSTGIEVDVDPQTADVNLNSGGADIRARNGAGATYGVDAYGILENSVTGVDVQGVRGTAQVGSGSTADEATGVYAESEASGYVGVGWGLSAKATGADRNRGVESYAVAGANTSRNHGIITTADANSYGVENIGILTVAYDGSGDNSTTSNIGIYAASVALDTLADDYAVWAQGNVWISGYGWINGGTPILSDANLKTNPQPLDATSANNVLGALAPQSYQYLQQFDYLGVPSGTQLGLMAQEVQQVFPQAVASTIVPAQYDSAGVITHAAMTVFGIDYEKFVPLLIAGYQGQQATIAQMQDQMATMQQDLAACCANRNGTDQRTMDSGAAQPALRTSDAADQRLTITPNPFSEGTVIGYNLPKAGMVSLQVSDASGKSLFNLFEGQQMEGTQRYDWNTSFLAPGVYHVTLLVDGAPLVRKAVKVAR
ncbi:MAG: tail fiber domain-containing protein [Flavobacteriales bacterium]|nr:tail fiber domain-containing protein [Flavobacteriales bacterium]MBK7270765.1 tail fiber domain-containing protein [Flavobacteriales bacterium]MBK9076035.1 tail fiber domain-containing protein [Flavobacteriales bacterium]MBK9537194.1 tail fiber domain-containing protein [Flavobacteriales bacterium]